MLLGAALKEGPAAGLARRSRLWCRASQWLSWPPWQRSTCASICTPRSVYAASAADVGELSSVISQAPEMQPPSHVHAALHFGPCSTAPAPAAWRQSRKEEASVPITGNGSAFRCAVPPPRTTQPPAPYYMAAPHAASHAGDTKDTGSTPWCHCLPSANPACSRCCCVLFTGAASTHRPLWRPAGRRPPSGTVRLVWIICMASPKPGDTWLIFHFFTTV